MIETLFCLVTLFVLLVAAIARPTLMRCPSGWFVNGVRPSGRTECIRDEDGRPERIEMQIYCANGLVPLVDDRDGRTIACQRWRP